MVPLKETCWCIRKVTLIENAPSLICVADSQTILLLVVVMVTLLLLLLLMFLVHHFVLSCAAVCLAVQTLYTVN